MVHVVKVGYAPSAYGTHGKYIKFAWEATDGELRPAVIMLTRHRSQADTFDSLDAAELACQLATALVHTRYQAANKPVPAAYDWTIIYPVRIEDFD